MDYLFFLLTIVSVLVLATGLIKPRAVILWGNGESKTRKKVLKYYGLTTLLFFILIIVAQPDITLGNKASTIIFILMVLTVLGFVVGLISPREVIKWGNEESKTRKKVLIYYGLAIFLFFAIFVVSLPELTPEKKAALAQEREEKQQLKEEAIAKAEAEKLAKQEAEQQAKQEAEVKDKQEYNDITSEIQARNEAQKLNKTIKNSEKERLLLDAVKRENHKTVKLLLKDGADPNAIGSSGSALMIASQRGYEDIVEELLKYDANPNYNIEGITALMLAVEEGYHDIVKLLIDYEANVNISTKTNDTALHIATAREKLNHKLIETLLEAKANPNVQNVDGVTPLIYVARSRENMKEWLFGEIDDSAEVLLEYNANPDIKDNDGYNAIMWATIRNWVNMVELMLDAGANTEIKDNNGNSLLTIANNMGRDDIVAILLERGGN